MKIKYLNIIFLFFISALVLMSSCKEEDNWGGTTYTKYAPANLTDPAISGVVDTAFTVTYTLTEPGALNLYIVPAGTENPDSTDIVSNATTRIEMTAAGDAVYTFALDSADIEPGASWDIFATFASPKGVLSLVNQSIATTTDTRKPILDIAACSPAHESVGNAKDVEIVLSFTEAVQYVDGKEIRLEASLSGVQSITTAADVAVNGNTVTISHAEFDFNDEVVIVFEASTFTDMSGNEVRELVVDDYIFDILPEIDFSKITGGYYVASENEVGFGNGESGGYWVSTEKFDNHTLQINNLWSTGSTILLDLNAADNTFDIALQQIGLVHSGTGQDIMVYDTDPFGVGASTGLVPGTFNLETGELKFFAWIHIAAGSFGFYEYDLLRAETPQGTSLGSQGILQNVRSFER